MLQSAIINNLPRIIAYIGLILCLALSYKIQNTNLLIFDGIIAVMFTLFDTRTELVITDES